MTAPSTSLRLASAYHNDDDDKIVVVDDTDTTDEDIHKIVAFQELAGQYDIIREPPTSMVAISSR